MWDTSVFNNPGAGTESLFSGGMFDGYNILAGFIFGTIGWGALRFGRQLERTKPIIIGLSLMIYPYFVYNKYLLWGIGTTLLVLLWFNRHD